MSREETPSLSAGALALAAVALAGLLAACARRLDRVAVAGTSMVPTLLPGDRLLVWRGPAYRAGDLVVVARASRTDRRAEERAESVVKRVAALGAEGVVVVGDNPAASTDSRDYGALPLADLRGRVVYRYAPAGRAGRVSGGVPTSPPARSAASASAPRRRGRPR